MDSFARYAYLVAWSGCLGSAAVAAEPAQAIVARVSGENVTILADGSLFAEYRTNGKNQPVVWPLYNADGEAMTRSFPLGSNLPGEKVDHPHHQSLWFAHGGVNGHDFWHPSHGDPVDATRIIHRGYTAVASGDLATIESRNDWMAGDRHVCSDTRRLVFGQSGRADQPPVRWIDYTVTLHASAGDVRFADTKEGTLGLRVPGPMKTDAGYGGTLSMADGATGANAWGKTASWALYAGPTRLDDGKAVAPSAVAVMNHPGSAGGACRWHIRTYGLFAANPFGESDFTSTPRQRPRDLPHGESITFRYLIALFADPPESAAVDSLYERFAANRLGVAAAGGHADHPGRQGSTSR